MKCLWRIILIVILTGLVPGVYAQRETPTSKGDTSKPAVLSTIQLDNDTIPVIDISEIEIYPKPHFKTRRQYRRYGRYVSNVKKVYPYARYLAQLLPEMEQHLDSVQSTQERRRYIKSKEKELKNRFEDDIWNMTYSQGKILLKLIDRETGRSSFAILEEMKGDFSAGFWQAIARIFGSDLKIQFDPQGEDRILNQVVIMIENGRI